MNSDNERAKACIAALASREASIKADRPRSSCEQAEELGRLEAAVEQMRKDAIERALTEKRPSDPPRPSPMPTARRRAGGAPTPPSGPFAHPEAFCLMTFASKDRMLVERIWNSRDGVTPFGINSPCGKHEMLHVKWQDDAFRPFHRPSMGDRIFIDMTIERRRAIAAIIAERSWDDANYPARDRYASKADMVERLVDDFDPALREPDMLTIADPWHVVAVCAAAHDEHIRIAGYPPVSDVARIRRFA